MWVFGYGSLLWYTDFPYVEAVPGVVKGYSRRFYQLSPDHRGTPEQPGRAVTLVPDENGTTWGLAYKVPDEAVESTIEYLNFRERAGYTCEQVEFHPDDGSEPFNLFVYISLDNHYYNPSTMEEIVNTIIRSRGRSGTNLEYALRLADVQRRLAPHYYDHHLFELERRLLDACVKLKVEDKILQVLGYKLDYLTCTASTDKAQIKTEELIISKAA